MILVEALDTYVKNSIKDNELGRIPKTGERFKVSQERSDILMGNNQYKEVFVRIVDNEDLTHDEKDFKKIKTKRIVKLND